MFYISTIPQFTYNNNNYDDNNNNLRMYNFYFLDLQFTRQFTYDDDDENNNKTTTTTTTTPNNNNNNNNNNDVDDDDDNDDDDNDDSDIDNIDDDDIQLIFSLAKCHGGTDGGSDRLTQRLIEKQGRIKK